MTLRIFQDPNWKLVKTLRVFRDSIVDWAEPKKVSVWRDPDGDDVGFWNLVYPDLPMVLATPSVSGTGRLGTSYSLSDSTPWVEDGYVKVQTTTYQWAKSLTSGGPYTDISGATSATYTVQQQDTESGGYYFICKITGTNAKGSTIVNSTQSLRAYDPDYTFQFGRSLGVNARSAIMFDEQSGGGFPNSLFVAGRVLGMFIGSWKFFDLYYKSDLSTLRIYYRFYRASQTTRPASPSGEIEVVFTSGSQFAEVYVPNPVSPVYVESYSAYILDLFTTLQSYEPLLVRNVGGRSFSNGVVTISTTTSHSFPVGASVYVTNADDRFNGVYPIIGTTSTTIQYNVSITSSITNKSLTSNVATLTTSAAHSFNVGDSVSITGVDSVFNGNYTITAVPSTTTFRYSRVNSNIASTSSGGTATLTNVPFALISSSANARAARSISDASYKFTVPLSDTGSVSMSVQSGSTSPSFLSGWIYIGSGNDVENTTITFTPGSSQSSPIATNINGSFNKQNMYWPTIATIAEPTYVSNSFAYVSWSGSNANSYSITVKRADNSTIVYGPETTTLPEQTINGLSLGTTYNIEVSPNSRSDRLGQFGLTSTKSYLHATVPSAPTNVSGTKGNAQVALTWTAPASTNGSAITGYKVRYSTNGGVSWLPATPLSTGSTSNSYTVTGLTNGTSYIFQVLATNAKGDSLWSTSSASIIPEIVPTKIAVTASPTSILTIGGTSTFTAQLQDASNNNVAKSGVSITFSMTAALGGSINNTTVTTDATGKATTTYTSSTTSGTATVKATSTGLTDGSASITVSARTGLTPSLTSSAQNYGVSVAHNNYNSSYTYSGNITSPGTLRTGQVFGSSLFTVSIPVQDGANQPGISGDNAINRVTCTISNVWVQNPPVNITVTSNRDGYNSVSSTLFSVQGNRARNSILYELINTANGNVMYSINSTTATTINYTYAGADQGKVVRWRCTAYYNDGSNSTRSSGTRTLG